MTNAATSRVTYDLKGLRGIITGASQGLGAAMARELARCGADLVITARNGGKLDALVTEISQSCGTKVVAVACDLRDKSSPGLVLEKALTAFDGLDILINNAGATKRGDFLSLSDDDFLDGFALKFHATVRLTKAAWSHLKSSRGSIINIVGIGSNTPAMDFTIGGPVNSALINFTKAIADRGLVDGVRINAINPGHIVTDRFHHRIEAMSKQLGISIAEAQERARVELGIQRFGQSEEIAALAAFLCSAESSYIHGAKIDIDGGASKGI